MGLRARRRVPRRAHTLARALSKGRRRGTSNGNGKRGDETWRMASLTPDSPPTTHLNPSLARTASLSRPPRTLSLNGLYSPFNPTPFPHPPATPATQGRPFARFHATQRSSPRSSLTNSNYGYDYYGYLSPSTTPRVPAPPESCRRIQTLPTTPNHRPIPQTPP